MSTKNLLILGIIVIAAILIGFLVYNNYYTSSETNSRPEKITIFSAGSLGIPLKQLGMIYREKYGIGVYLETSGSVDAVRKITDLHRRADVLAVADYTLLDKLLGSKYVDWYAIFATNQVVLVYTDHSKYHEELEKDPSKWPYILMRKDVRWGFSNPNKDPCGYRSVGIIVLASKYYSDPKIIDLILNNTNIKVEQINDGYKITVPVDLKLTEGTNLVMRDKSIDLIGLIEAGALDYAFEYKSVAIQHNLSYIELPPQINLGDPDYKDYYEKVELTILAGSNSERTFKLKLIGYGITVPKNAEHPKEGLEFVKLLLSDTGRQIFEKNGQAFLPEPILKGNAPKELEQG